MKTYSSISINMKDICKKKLRKLITSMVCISVRAKFSKICSPSPSLPWPTLDQGKKVWSHLHFRFRNGDLKTNIHWSNQGIPYQSEPAVCKKQKIFVTVTQCNNQYWEKKSNFFVTCDKGIGEEIKTSFQNWISPPLSNCCVVPSVLFRSIK